MNDVMNSNELKQVAKDVCEKALLDAKTHLHPLLHQVQLERLDQRCEFLQAFKSALEKELAQKIALLQPGVKAVYKFDAAWGSSAGCWDNTIHLLVLVPRLINQMKDLGAKLDRDVLKRLRRLSWPRFQNSKSILEIQQVTLDEMRHSVSYGAMFLSLHAAPSRIWPLG